MRTTDFDALAASAPLNREAATVRDGSGDRWDGKVPSFHAHWDAPPLPEHERPCDLPDMAGLRFGRMTVIRFHRRRKYGAQWLVRCTCGGYELRKTSAIKALIAGTTGATEEHCCAKCDWLRHVQHRAARASTAENRAAELAGFDRLADRAGCCVECKTPATCKWNAKCGLLGTEAA
jgi:hypothetical protein